MFKLLRLLVCLLVMSASSVIFLGPQSAFAKQKEEKIEKKESVVYVTKSGKKYHAENCPFISNRETTTMNEQEAISKGLTPCGRCMKQEEAL